MTHETMDPTNFADPPRDKSEVADKVDLTITSEGYIKIRGVAPSGAQAEITFDLSSVRILARRLLALCDVAEGAADDSPG